MDKRLEFLQKNFVDVKEDDVVIADFACSLQRDGVVHGRVYFSYYGYYFRAKILGFTSAVSNYWKDVVEIKKESAAFLPVLIQIISRHEKHTFSFLSNRDKIYTLVNTAWQNQWAPEPLSQEILIAKAEPILISNDNPLGQEARTNTEISKETHDFHSVEINPLIFSPESEKKSISSLDRSQSSQDISAENLLGKRPFYNVDEISIDLNCNCSTGDGKLMIEQIFKTNFEELKHLFFDDKSPVLNKLASVLNLQNFEIKNLEKNRIMTYLHPMGFPFPPISTETIFEFHPPNIWEGPHCWVDSTSTSKNVMYSDSFKVNIKYCFTDEANGVLIKVYFKVDFLKKVVGGIKNIITNRASSKTNEYVTTLFKLVESHLDSQELSKTNNTPEALPIETIPKEIIPPKSIRSIILDYIIGATNTFVNFFSTLDLDSKCVLFYLFMAFILYFHLVIVNRLITLLSKQNSLIESLTEMIIQINSQVSRSTCPSPHSKD